MLAFLPAGVNKYEKLQDIYEFEFHYKHLKPVLRVMTFQATKAVQPLTHRRRI